MSSDNKMTSNGFFEAFQAYSSNFAVSAAFTEGNFAVSAAIIEDAVRVSVTTSGLDPEFPANNKEGESPTSASVVPSDLKRVR